MQKNVLLLLAVVVVLQFGCKDPNRPEDLPKLYPVSITVTQEGKTLEGATVTLNAKTPSKYGTASADTNASGVAVIRTYGFDGVPLGQYVVTIEKRGVEGAKESTNDEGLIVSVGGKVYQYVDPQYRMEDTSPLSIEVTEKGAKDTYEVGAPAHEFLMDMG